MKDRLRTGYRNSVKWKIRFAAIGGNGTEVDNEKYTIHKQKNSIKADTLKHIHTQINTHANCTPTEIRPLSRDTTNPPSPK